MKGTYNKEYDFSIVVSADDLKYLSEMIASEFKYQNYEIKTKDGAEYTVDNIDEVLGYSNPNSRKIETIVMKGNKEKDKNFIYPNIRVSLCDSTIYSTSCNLTLRDSEEKHIIYYNQRIAEFAKSIRAPYWWLHKSGFYYCMGIVLYVILATIILSNTENTEAADRVYNVLTLQGVSALCMFFSMYSLKKTVSFFYPESCFCIGEQTKNMNKKQKMRNLTFVVIIGSIVLSIISGIILFFIEKNFLN